MELVLQGSDTFRHILSFLTPTYDCKITNTKDHLALPFGILLDFPFVSKMWCHLFYQYCLPYWISKRVFHVSSPFLGRIPRILFLWISNLRLEHSPQDDFKDNDKLKSLVRLTHLDIENADPSCWQDLPLTSLWIRNWSWCVCPETNTNLPLPTSLTSLHWGRRNLPCGYKTCDLRQCPQLEHLTLTNWKHISDNFFLPMHLTSLMLIDCYELPAMMDLNTNILLELKCSSRWIKKYPSRTFSNLKQLSLDFVPDVGNESDDFHILEYMTGLTCLTLSQCELDLVYFLPATMPLLERFSLYDFMPYKDNKTISLATYFPALHSVELHGCTFVDWRSTYSLSMIKEVILVDTYLVDFDWRQTLPNLQILTLHEAISFTVDKTTTWNRSDLERNQHPLMAWQRIREVE